MERLSLVKEEGMLRAWMGKYVVGYYPNGRTHVMTTKEISPILFNVRGVELTVANVEGMVHVTIPDPLPDDDSALEEVEDIVEVFRCIMNMHVFFVEDEMKLPQFAIIMSALERTGVFLRNRS